MVRRSQDYIRFVIFGLLLVLLFILQSVPGLLPKIFGVLPVPVIPAVVCTALFEREWSGAIIGLTAGILMDVNSMQITGFNALFLMVAGCTCSLFVTHLIRNNLLSAIAVSAATTALYFLLYSLLFNPAGDFMFYYLWRYLLPRSVYTILFSIPIYIIIRGFMKKIRKNQQF